MATLRTYAAKDLQGCVPCCIEVLHPLTSLGITWISNYLAQISLDAKLGFSLFQELDCVKKKISYHQMYHISIYYLKYLKGYRKEINKYNKNR
jgi:hypothetical protein